MNNHKNKSNEGTVLATPAKLLLLAALLKNDRIISNNGKSFLKELILRRDERLDALLEKFESKHSGDNSFLETLHELIMSEAHSQYDELFSDTSLEVGKTLSKTEREQKQLSEEKSLIYGEVEFDSFYRVLRKINPLPGLVFYDLGSGTGKAVFAARFAFDFSKCIGVEILTSLHQQALKVLNKYNNEFKMQLALGQSQHAMVYEGSFLDYDWSDGDLVFANSTCFDDFLMGSLSDMAGRLKPGSIVVTFTKGMSNPAFELLERKRYRMSWGPATVFIHRKLNADGSTVGPPQLNILPSDSVTYEDDYPESSLGQAAYPNYDDEEEEVDSDGDDDDIDLYIRRNPIEPNAEEDDDNNNNDVAIISEDINEVNNKISYSSPNHKVESDSLLSKTSTPISLSKKTAPANASATRLNSSSSSSSSSLQYNNIVAEHTPSHGHMAESPLRKSISKAPLLSPQQLRNSGNIMSELGSPTCLNSPIDSGLLMRKRAAPRKTKNATDQ